MKLKDRIALVTGGGTGIGFAAAKALAAEGACVTIAGRRAEKLEAACRQIAAPHPVRAITCDVGDRDAARRLVEAVLAAHGRIDILVNNHGVNIAERRMEVLSGEGWDKLLRINATGVFNTIHAVLPGMRARRDGLIITVSSIAGCRPSVLGGAAYSASKHAATALTRVLAEEEMHSGIRATVISPGEVNTPILDERPVPVSAEHRARILQPEDVAAAIVFVATLPPRAHVPDLVIKPTTQSFA
jgi:NADP-dependent 3-hydroxy acid dehydrogenase YdfG